MAEREPGPYWVRCEGANWEEHAKDNWIVALWDGHYWGVPFDYEAYRDPQFAEIGERCMPYRNRPWWSPFAILAISLVLWWLLWFGFTTLLT